jgi:acetyltransferase
VTIHNLDCFFNPRRIAVVGASDQPGKVGTTLLHNLVGRGYDGVVYPVNAKREAVQGIAAYKSLAELPHAPDLVVVATPAATVPDLVDQCGRMGVMAVLVISAGFREAGPEGVALEQQVKAAAARYPGLRIMGPNCLGFMVPSIGLNASFAGAMALQGRVAFVSQSGALCTSILDWANAQGIGFSHFLSIGNMLDVGLHDLLDYLAGDPQTDAVVLYVESITQARAFMSAARALARDKPIVAYKAGRFAASAQAAASHTGAMAGVDAVYEAAFRRAGIVRVFDIDEMFDCAELLARERVPRGPRLAVITNAGGPGVMASDALLERRGTLAQLDGMTIDELSRVLPPFWSHGNPIDVLGDAGPERYRDALALVLADENVDGVLVLLTPQAMTDAGASASAVIEASRRRTKPVLAAWMGEAGVHAGVSRLHAAGVPTYATAERAVRAFMSLVEFARNREVLIETPREVPVPFSLDAQELRRRFMALKADSASSTLSEDASKELLANYGIGVSLPVAAASAGEAVGVAERIGYPVVLKIHSPEITHKTDVGGVVLDLANGDAVRVAFERITESARRLRPDARVLGVTVQKMVAAVHGVELIVGMKRDPVFGPVIMVGFGGVTAELFQDRALELPPLDERLARRMLESLRAWPLLTGYRGRPVVHVERLIETLMRFSYLVAHLPEIAEIDINPLLVTPTDVIGLDARVILSGEAGGKAAQPFSHLAIRPYPEEWVKEVRLADGSELLMRPIRPEDEPLWHELVASCSPETLRQRFRYLFKLPSHTTAARFCFLDYDREIAIVAETLAGGQRRLVGVGRLIADADHQTAEFAVLVADPWQGRGLGSLLMDYCLTICQRWGVREVTAETAPDNVRMLAMFQRRGFALDRSVAPDVVVVKKEIPTGA